MVAGRLTLWAKASMFRFGGYGIDSTVPVKKGRSEGAVPPLQQREQVDMQFEYRTVEGEINADQTPVTGSLHGVGSVPHLS